MDIHSKTLPAGEYFEEMQKLAMLHQVIPTLSDSENKIEFLKDCSLMWKDC
jgi:hypothetical protein